MTLHAIATDSETLPFMPGNMTPPSACWSSDIGDGKPALHDRVMGVRVFGDRLGDTGVLNVLHNASYDMAVAVADYARLFKGDLLPVVFQALDQCRVTDTGIRQKILDLGGGHLGFDSKGGYEPYRLASLTKRHTAVELDKEDGTRMSYGDLANTPLEKWPTRARDYAITDALATRLVWAAQGGHQPVVTEHEQARADWALHLMSVWGMRTDRASVEALERRQDALILEVAQSLTGTGLLNGVSKREKAIRALVLADWGDRKGMPVTDGGAPSLAAENLRACTSPALRRLADLVEAQWIKANPVPALWAGVSIPINARYDVLKETGRTGCSKPNMQNWKRTGGIRECFVPRPGMLFCSVDYETLELRTLAQDLFELFGEGEMVRALRADRDLHVDMASVMLGVSYEEAFAWYKGKGTPEQKTLAKDKRQFSKAGNFGIPGGMGATGLVMYAAGMGVTMDLGQAQVVVDYYFRRWPEMNKYFQYIKSQLGVSGYAAFTHPVSGLRCGRATFTAMANSRFQARAALGAKRALYEVTYRCYVDRNSALYGSRPVAFLHDEILAEVPVDGAHEAAQELALVMREQMSAVCPDIPIKAKPALMARWYKDAEDVSDTNGRLIPWEPKP